MPELLKKRLTSSKGKKKSCPKVNLCPHPWPFPFVFILQSIASTPASSAMSGALLDWPCVSFKADVQPTHCPSVDSDATTESAFDDFLSLLVTSNGATVGPPNLDARCQSAASPVEAPTPPCKEAAERSRVDKPSARRSVHAGSSRPPAAHPVRRVISNDTYLRRMHLSPEQTIALMPSLASSLLPVATKASVRARMSF